jgi:hypothetical protein
MILIHSVILYLCWLNARPKAYAAMGVGRKGRPRPIRPRKIQVKEGESRGACYRFGSAATMYNVANIDLITTTRKEMFS